jgi:Tfp pilus assembly protein PilN
MQQVNLVSALPQKQEFFSARILMLIVGASLGLLLLFSLFYELVITYHYYQVKKTKALQQQTTKQVQELFKKYPLFSGDLTVKEMVDNLDGILRQKKSTWETITKISLRKGFSGYLVDLAKYVPSSIWLKTIIINQESGVISLQGRSMDVTAVPELMKNLSQAPAFKQKLLNIFTLDTGKNLGIVDFEVANKELLSKQGKSDEGGS